MGSARTEISFSLDLFLYDLKELLFVIKGMILPGDTMNAECVIYQSQYNSTSCYVPLFGLSLVFAFIKTERSWLRNLTLALGVTSLFPILQSAFLLFTESYQRWWFMFTLILALVTVRVMIKPDQYSVGTGTLVYAVAVVLFYTVIRCLDRLDNNDPYVFIEDHFVIYCVIAVSGPLLTVLLHKLKAWNSHTLLGLVMFSCILTTALTLHYYRTGTDSDSFNQDYQLAAQLKVIDDQYRYNTSDNMMTAPGDAAGYVAFTSTIENSSRQFDTMFDLYSTSQGWRRVEIPGLPQLLGARYSLTLDSNVANTVDEVSWNGNTLYVTEQDAFPIGFAINAYMYEDELSAIPQENRALALMQAAVIRSEDEDQVNSCMHHIDVGAINYGIPVDDMISYSNHYAVEDFKRSAHGFTCKTSYDSEQMVYYTVPYDEGWTATIDGVETDIVYSGGMMLLQVPAGVHQIIFTYDTPGLDAGIVISLISSVLFVIYWFNSRRVGGAVGRTY